MKSITARLPLLVLTLFCFTGCPSTPTAEKVSEKSPDKVLKIIPETAADKTNTVVSAAAVKKAVPYNPETCSFPKDDDALKKLLTPEQYAITKKNGTERPFENSYWNNHHPGIYVDIISKEPLFSSKDKFESGSGWPSFTKPLNKDAVVEKSDGTHGMDRMEIRSKRADSHLGHVFDDGPKDKGGLRYCLNSGSLKFIPLEKMKDEGYEAWIANNFTDKELKEAQDSPYKGK